MTGKMGIIFVVVSCCAGCIALSSRANYDIELAVDKKSVARNFVIACGDFTGEVYDTSINHKFIYTSISVAMPDTMLCSWSCAQGEIYSATIPVKSCLPQAFRSSRDTLVFTLTPSNSVDFSVGIWYEKYRQRRVPIGTFQGRLKGE